MATTKQLLELTPDGAIVKMVNDANGTFFDGGETGPLVISPPLNVGGLRTEVELTIRRRISRSEKLPVQGKLAFRYNRLDVEGTLLGVLAGFRPSMPTSTQVLLDELTARTGIIFHPEDFVLEDIYAANATPYTLRAKPESRRWVGELPVTLIDLVDLASYVAGGLSGGPFTVALHSPPTSTKDNQPYVNATTFRKMLDDVPLNTTVTSLTDPLAQFVVRTVPKLGEFLREGPSPWQVSTTAGPYNLRGATLIAKDESVTGVNPLAPGATRAVRIRLSALDTAYGQKDLVIPYATPDVASTGYTAQPRLKSAAVINTSDGTYWNVWLNSLTAPSVVQSLPAGMNLLISGPQAWTADPAIKSPTSLYNAVVQYNGQRRSYDMPPFYGHCNRVIVLTLSESNTAYKGNVTFHYRAPIILPETLPSGTVTYNYDFDLTPSEGVGPYLTRIVSGKLAPGHQLLGTHRIAGPTTTAGTHNVTIEVTDSRGVKVLYNYRYTTVLGQLLIMGSAPQAQVGEDYAYDFSLKGGSGEYFNPTVVAGQLPPGLSLNLFGDELQFSGVPTLAGNYLFTISIESSDGQYATIETTMRVVA